MSWQRIAPAQASARSASMRIGGVFPGVIAGRSRRSRDLEDVAYPAAKLSIEAAWKRVLFLALDEFQFGISSQKAKRFGVIAGELDIAGRFSGAAKAPEAPIFQGFAAV